MTSNLDPASLEAACKAAGGLSSWEAAAAITAYLNTLSHAGEGEPSAEQINQFQFLRSLQVDIFTCIGLDSEKLRHAKALRKRGYVTIADSANGPMVNLTEEGAVASLDWPAFCATPRPDTAEGERDLVGLSASDRACYLYPEADQQLLRAAYVAGAVDYSKPAPQAGGVSEALPEAFVTENSASGKYWVEIKCATMADMHRWHDAVLNAYRASKALAPTQGKDEG